MEGNTGKSMDGNHGIVGSSNPIPNLGVVSAETLSASETLRRYSLGYRFNPLNQELILGYLLRKIKGLSLPTNLMHEVDIYLHTPEHLTVNYEPQGDKIWYFFTPRVKRYKKGSRPNRSAEDGYWKATRVEKTIKTNDDQEIGFKKTLVYYRGNNASDGVKTNWIMHEFRINGPSLLGPSLKWKRDMYLASMQDKNV
ncbi:NAC transcription factor 47-like [Beta vulgaris subsp. vulgaris]|uniref:NAC transcription factor 47-like n=1 Tax=Beta vulgaris subsp. vulgaris TaxID=3555 RepID=UPI0025468E46|nr:NAC transcription factor 47-like [Beta vulgaris subsp. vulgaris]